MQRIMLIKCLNYIISYKIDLSVALFGYLKGKELHSKCLQHLIQGRSVWIDLYRPTLGRYNDLYQPIIGRYGWATVQCNIFTCILTALRQHYSHRLSCCIYRGYGDVSPRRDERSSRWRRHMRKKLTMRGSGLEASSYAMLYWISYSTNRGGAYLRLRRPNSPLAHLNLR